MQKAIKIMVTIVALLVLAVGTVEIHQFAKKTLVMANQLAIISDNIKLYNDSPKHSEEWTQEIKELMSYREENYYKSSDWWTRTFSNMFVLWKMFIVIGMILIYPILAFMYFCLCAMFLAVRKKKRRSRRRTR